MREFYYLQGDRVLHMIRRGMHHSPLYPSPEFKALNVVSHMLRLVFAATSDSGTVREATLSFMS